MIIGIWGDSIAYGSCDGEALGWVGRIRRVLSAHEDTKNLYNFGICGDTTADLLRRFSIEVEALQPDEIVFAVGINDSKYPNDSEVNLVSLPEYRKNMQTLISQAQQYTSKITLVGATPVDDGWRSVRGSRFFNEEILKYNVAMKEIADTNNLLYIEMFDVIDTTADLQEGLHPNTQGYQKMFERFISKKSF